MNCFWAYLTASFDKQSWKKGNRDIYWFTLFKWSWKKILYCIRHTYEWLYWAWNLKWCWSYCTVYKWSIKKRKTLKSASLSGYNGLERGHNCVTICVYEGLQWSWKKQIVTCCTALGASTTNHFINGLERRKEAHRNVCVWMFVMVLEEMR